MYSNSLAPTSTEVGTREEIIDIAKGFPVPIPFGDGWAFYCGILNRTFTRSQILGAGAEIEGIRIDDFLEARGLSMNDVRARTLKIHPSISALTPPGKLFPIPTRGDTFNGSIPNGLITIVGPSNFGKSPLATSIALEALANVTAENGYGIVRSGEGFPGYGVSHDESAASLAEAIFKNEVVVLDSMKNVFSASGNAMKSGISRTSVEQMSYIGTIAATFRTTILAIVNPSDAVDLDSLGPLVEMMKGNTTGFISVPLKPTLHEDFSSWTFEFRTGEGLPRSVGFVRFMKEETNGRFLYPGESGASITPVHTPVSGITSDSGVELGSGTDILMETSNAKLSSNMRQMGYSYDQPVSKSGNAAILSTLVDRSFGQ